MGVETTTPPSGCGRTPVWEPMDSAIPSSAAVAALRFSTACEYADCGSARKSSRAFWAASTAAWAWATAEPSAVGAGSGVVEGAGDGDAPSFAGRDEGATGRAWAGRSPTMAVHAACFCLTPSPARPET